jgi:hypothetical protein
VAEPDQERAERYLAYLTDAIRVSATQPPQFGTGKPVTFEQFKTLYGGDPFYSWLGLDSEYLYTAHHAGAAMTSLYRKLGDGCQNLFRAIIRDQFGVSDEQAKWSYTIPKPGGRKTTRELDGYIDILEFPESEALDRFRVWLGDAKEALRARLNPRGAVFEVRQGYKSQDAKRSTGDVDNAGQIALQSSLPVLAVFSRQLPTPIARRYHANGWLILSGDLDGDALSSTYAFSKLIMGFDLAAFLDSNVESLRTETLRVFEGLLTEYT